MVEHKKTKTGPHGGGKQRRTTLSLTPELWDWLKRIEEETGARPSVTVRRTLQKILSKKPRNSKP